MDTSIFRDSSYTYGSPAYIYNLDELKARVDIIKECLTGTANVCFAMKSNPFVVGEMNSYTDRFEVCSPGEYEICHKRNIPPEKIIISGVNKTYDSIKRIITLSGGLGIYTIESFEHYKILDDLSKEFGITLNVLIRLSSGNQFGVDNGEFEAIVKKITATDNLKLQGVHFYSGTQKRMKKIEKELTELDEYGEYLKAMYGLDDLELEYGPGLCVNYFEADKAIDDKAELMELKALLDNITNFSKITIEMGRFIAADCGYYVSTVKDVKTTEGHNYCIIDGGIHQINYFGQLMGMKRPFMELLTSNTKVTTQDKWNICGSLCTVNDVIVKDAMFPQISIGDMFVFKNCGAYSVTEGMAMFLSRDLPKVLFYSAGKFQLVRDTIETEKYNTFMEDK